MKGPWQDAEQARASWFTLEEGTRVAMCRSVKPQSSCPAAEQLRSFHTLLRPLDHMGTGTATSTHKAKQNVPASSSNSRIST